MEAYQLINAYHSNLSSEDTKQPSETSSPSEFKEEAKNNLDDSTGKDNIILNNSGDDKQDGRRKDQLYNNRKNVTTDYQIELESQGESLVGLKS